MRGQVGALFHHVAFVKQKLGEVGAVLPGDPRDEGHLRRRVWYGGRRLHRGLVLRVHRELRVPVTTWVRRGVTGGMEHL